MYPVAHAYAPPSQQQRRARFCEPAPPFGYAPAGTGAAGDGPAGCMPQLNPIPRHCGRKAGREPPQRRNRCPDLAARLPVLHAVLPRMQGQIRYLQVPPLPNENRFLHLAHALFFPPADSRYRRAPAAHTVSYLWFVAQRAYFYVSLNLPPTVTFAVTK